MGSGPGRHDPDPVVQVLAGSALVLEEGAGEGSLPRRIKFFKRRIFQFGHYVLMFDRFIRIVSSAWDLWAASDVERKRA